MQLDDHLKKSQLFYTESFGPTIGVMAVRTGGGFGEGHRTRSDGKHLLAQRRKSN